MVTLISPCVFPFPLFFSPLVFPFASSLHCLFLIALIITTVYNIFFGTNFYSSLPFSPLISFIYFIFFTSSFFVLSLYFKVLPFVYFFFRISYLRSSFHVISLLFSFTFLTRLLSSLLISSNSYFILTPFLLTPLIFSALFYFSLISCTFLVFPFVPLFLLLSPPLFFLFCLPFSVF